MHICFSTIGDDGSRQCRSYAAILAAVLRFSNDKSVTVEHFSHKSSMNSLQYIFHVIKNLHKEMHMFFFHYWRRREPPVSLRIGDSRCSFAKSNLYFSKGENLQR